jgi:hypothetical protein
MNHDDLIVPYLKNQLVPKGTLPVVSIGWNDSSMSTAFYDVSFIHAACDELGRRLKSHVVDPITPLEKLAIELLLASAYISDFDDRVRALASFQKHLAADK